MLRKTDLPKRWSYSRETRQPGGQTSRSFSTEPDFSLHLGLILEKLGAFENFRVQLTTDDNYRAVQRELSNDQKEKFWTRPKNLAFAIIGDHLKHHPTLYPKAALIDEIVSNFSYCIANGVLGVRIVSPLEGFSSSARSVQVDDGLFITKLTPNKFLKLFPIKSVEQAMEHQTWGHLIEFSAEHPITNVPHDEINRKADFKKLVHALRLLKPGKIAAPYSMWLPLKPGFINAQRGRRYSAFKNPILRPEYRLLPKEANILRTIYAAMGNEFPRAVSIAADRIDVSVERRTKEDEFIDHIIALEALFGDTNNATGSISYKIALRASMLMHNDKLSRERTFSKLKRVIGIRGKVVHGATTLSAMRQNEQELALWLGVFARHAVTEILLHYPDYAEATADEHILSLVRP